MSKKREKVHTKKHPGMYKITPFFEKFSEPPPPSKLNLAAPIKVRWLCLCVLYLTEKNTENGCLFDLRQISPLPDNKTLDWSNRQAFADHILKVTNMMKFILNKVGFGVNSE